MALAITGGAPEFIGEVAALAANDDTFLEASFPFENMELAAVEAVDQLNRIDAEYLYSIIIYKGFIITTANANADNDAQFLSDLWVTQMNENLVG